MRRAHGAFLLAMLLIPLRSSAEPQDRPRLTAAPDVPSLTGMIVGQVIDARTGRGVSGAVVSLSGGPGSLPDGTIASAALPPERASTQRVLATGDGRFVFRGLPPGMYHVTARKAGYIEGAYGRRLPGGATRTLMLADGEKTGDVNIALWRYGAITGTVIDETGDPVVGIEVRAMRQTLVAGRRRFSDAGTARTDDRGIYRLAMLTPGAYIVAVISTEVAVPAAVLEDVRRGPGGTRDPERTAALRALSEAGANTAGPGSSNAVQVGDMVRMIDRSYTSPARSADEVFVYPTVFFPSAEPSNDANFVAVASGEERAGVDFQLKPVPATPVSGRVLAPEGAVERVVLRLVPAAAEVFTTELPTATTVTSPDGSFTFPAVPAGAYLLHAHRLPNFATANAPATTVIQAGSGMIIMTGSPGGQAEPPVETQPGLWGRVPLNVDGRPLAGVDVPLHGGGRLEGRVTFDGAAARPKGDELTRIAVVAESSDGDSARLPPMRVNPGGSFRSSGLAPGRYLLRSTGAPPGWTFKSAMLDGRDVSDIPLEVGSSEISGVVVTFTDRPATLTGAVRTAQGAADPDATVLLFPADPGMWTGYGAGGRRFRAARASRSGTYTIAGLPAGSYAAIAVPDEQTADWQHPERLESLARLAARIQIADERSVTHNFTTER